MLGKEFGLESLLCQQFADSVVDSLHNGCSCLRWSCQLTSNVERIGGFPLWNHSHDRHNPEQTLLICDLRCFTCVSLKEVLYNPACAHVKALHSIIGDSETFVDRLSRGGCHSSSKNNLSAFRFSRRFHLDMPEQCGQLKSDP